MTMEEFHANFPSTIKRLEAENERASANEQAECVLKFCAKYTPLTWSFLVRQRKDVMTDDGCTHYRHRVTGEIYSWNYLTKEWTSREPQPRLNNLF